MGGSHHDQSNLSHQKNLKKKVTQKVKSTGTTNGGKGGRQQNAP